MKRFFGIFLLALIVLMGTLWFFRTNIATAFLTHKLKLGISFQDINFSKNEITFSNFKIKSPKEFKHETAFISKKVTVRFVWSQITGDPSLIDKVIFKDNILTVECNNPLCSNNNWTEIISNVSKSTEEADGTEVVIKSLVFENLHADVFGLGLSNGSKKSDVPSIELKDISSKKGFPTNELIAALFKQANLMDYIKDTLKSLKIFDKYFFPFKIFGTAEKEEKVEIK